jgi:hypothetical protein
LALGADRRAGAGQYRFHERNRTERLRLVPARANFDFVGSNSVLIAWSL